MQQDTSELKEKIISIFKSKGPSLPVHIAKETNQSILFASAFLSELIADKKIKISHMKVGSSPVYYLPGQEHQLEKFSEHLKSKEKDAFILLKEKQFLKDSEQEPAIRVALRSIKDFAKPFDKNNELYWKYLTANESELEKPKEQLTTPIATKLKFQKQQETETPKDLGIFNPSKEKIKTESKKTKEQTSEKKPKKKTKPKKTSKNSSANDKFFNKIKEFLSQKQIEIEDIQGFSKTDITLKISDSGKEKLLVAYNKKRISEKDITNAHKKASELNLPYIILSKGEPTKKIQSFIDAIKKMDGLKKFE